MTDPIIEMSTTGWIAKHRKQYQEDGEAGHMWDTSAAGGPGLLPTLLLTTTGRKSGTESIMPLLYGKVDGGYAVIASKGGAPKHPGWYHNMKAQGEVTVQIANDIFQANVRTAESEERAAIWKQMTDMYPPYADYQVKAGDREIPVIVLERIG